MEDWDEFDDEPEDEDESEDDDEGDDDEGDDDEGDDDEGDDEDEASEDQLALEAFDAFMDVEGDSDVAQASREALAAITDSALALKANREARERREALEQAAERERQEALARQEDERARQESRERAERRADAERQERARLVQEAQHLARERERLRIEQEQFEARRREDEARKAASVQTPACLPAHIPVESERHERVERNKVRRRPFHDRAQVQAQVRRPAEQGRHAAPVQEDETSKAARHLQRARDEQKWREAVRREEEARMARRERTAALAAQAQPVAARPPVNSRKKSVKRQKASGRRSDATTRRAERQAMHVVPASRPSQAVPPSPPRPPRRPSTPCSDRQRVASDLRVTVASATADREKRPRQTEPPALRPIRPDRPAALTGADLANWRSRLGLTQQAAATRLGVGQGTVSKAESRGTVPLGPALLRALAAALARERSA